MKITMPHYMEQFQCSAGDCPDTCCQDWVVVLDGDTVAKYEALDGDLGDFVGEKLTKIHGESCFDFGADGKCPMLEASGLCRIQREKGASYLGDVCDVHPRFSEEYGAVREEVCSLGCPEAARLLLTVKDPMLLVQTTNDEPISGYNSIDPRLYFPLVTLRKIASALVCNPHGTMAGNMDCLVEFGARFQKTLNQHRLQRLMDVCQSQEKKACTATPSKDGMQQLKDFFHQLETLEAINGKWAPLVGYGVECLNQSGYDWFGFSDYMDEHRTMVQSLLQYFIYRYTLKAVNDRALLPRLAFCVESVKAIMWMIFVCQEQFSNGQEDLFMEVIHRYCREIEHSEENMERLLSFFSPCVNG